MHRLWRKAWRGLLSPWWGAGLVMAAVGLLLLGALHAARAGAASAVAAPVRDRMGKAYAASARDGAGSEYLAGAQPSAPGAYASGATLDVRTADEVILHDAARGKDLPVKVYYAATGGPYPVIVFSHGAGGSKDVGAGLLSYWAEHGYVVIAPTHEDSIELRRAQGEQAGMGGIVERFGTDPQYRLSRVADDSFVISSLDELARRVPELAGKVDPARIGVGGHSAGAMTAMLSGGARNDMAINGPGGPEAADLRDGRVSCILVLSGQGITPLLSAFNEHSWDGVDEPMMVMTGSLDESTRTAQTPLSRCEPYYYAPAGGKYLVYIEGATHMSFTGKLGGDAGPDERLSGPMNRALGLSAQQEHWAESYDQAAIFSWVRMASLAFWDAHLKGSEMARQWLESGALDSLSHGQAGVWHK